MCTLDMSAIISYFNFARNNAFQINIDFETICKRKSYQNLPDSLFQKWPAVGQKLLKLVQKKYVSDCKCLSTSNNLHITVCRTENFTHLYSFKKFVVETKLTIRLYAILNELLCIVYFCFATCTFCTAAVQL